MDKIINWHKKFWLLKSVIDLPGKGLKRYSAQNLQIIQRSGKEVQVRAKCHYYLWQQWRDS